MLASGGALVRNDNWPTTQDVMLSQSVFAEEDGLPIRIMILSVSSVPLW